MSETWPPADAELLVSFVVSGDPKGAGSKDAIALGKRVGGRVIPYCRKDGTPMVNVVDTSGKPGKLWREAIAQAAMLALGEARELADGPLAVRATFYGASPKRRFGTGRNEGVLKATADRFPHQSDLPDGTKLARALEDALNSVAWADDRRVCDLWWSRRFGQDPGAVVDILALPVTVEPSQVRPAGQLAFG